MFRKYYLRSIISLIVVLVIIPYFCFAQEQNTNKKNAIKDVTPKEAYKLIQKYAKSGKLIILDVRTENEYEMDHIKGAMNINLYDDNFLDRLKKLDKSKKYLVYCRSGSRSRVAAYYMQDLGFAYIYNMKGGIQAWEDKGLPIVEGQ